MSPYLPFNIQSQIIKRLPVKSLLQFRSISKQWKSLIDSAEFINKYHTNHTNPQHHLFLSYELSDTVKTYTSIIDNNTFPQQKFPLTAPQSLSLLSGAFLLGSAQGLLCFYSYNGRFNSNKMVVIWNPTVRKSFAVDIPSHKSGSYTVIGFGVCPDRSVPKLVNITVDRIASMWEVEGKWYNRVLGFRNNGEVVMELDADNYVDSRIEVYEPLSGNTHGVGINGEMYMFEVASYMETLLLFDESDSVIH